MLLNVHLDKVPHAVSVTFEVKISDSEGDDISDRYCDAPDADGIVWVWVGILWGRYHAIVSCVVLSAACQQAYTRIYMAFKYIKYSFT